MIILKTLPTATKQEIFDQVSQHLLKQGHKSQNGTHCRYRSMDGMKCAAGCLMDNSEYDEKFEGFTWIELVDKLLVPKKYDVFIRDLQVVHDGASAVRWKELLEEFAETYDLECNF